MEWPIPDSPKFNPEFANNIKNIPELLDNLEKRLQDVERAIIEAAKKNWVERNPVLFMILSCTASALAAIATTIIATRLHWLPH